MVSRLAPMGCSVAFLSSMDGARAGVRGGARAGVRGGARAGVRGGARAGVRLGLGLRGEGWG